MMFRDIKIFLTACCNACHPSQSHHFLNFLLFWWLSTCSLCDWNTCTKVTLHPKYCQDRLIQPPLFFLIGKEAEKRRRRNKQKKDPAKSQGPCVWRNMVGNLQWNFSLHKLRTWPIHTGLRSQTSSTIITNYLKSPGNSNPVQIQFKGTASLQ